MFWVTCIMLDNLKLGLSATTILNDYHPEGHKAGGKGGGDGWAGRVVEVGCTRPPAPTPTPLSCLSRAFSHRCSRWCRP